MMRVAIVGGGAAGLLAAVHLRRSKPDAQITLIDASGRPGTGAADGTNDPTHLLNVPAARMSAWPDDPDHFARWLDQRAVTPAESFAPRLAYGRYLQDQLVAADVRIEAAEVVEFRPGAGRRCRRPGRIGPVGARRVGGSGVAAAGQRAGDRFGAHRCRCRAASHCARRDRDAALAAWRAAAPVPGDGCADGVAASR